MSITVEYQRITASGASQPQVVEFDNLDQALFEQWDGMDLFSASNPDAAWVAMRVVNPERGA